jgi:glycosyltransferase involved in cell wall biosynthesis
MRIVVDALGAQTSGSRNRGIGRYTKAFLHALIRNHRNHDIILAANGAFPEAIDDLRREFANSVAPEDLTVYRALPASDYLGGKHANRRLSELTREAALRSLHPDFVIVTSLFEGLVDDAVTSVGSVCTAPTAIVLYDMIPALFPKPYLEWPPTRQWYEEKLSHLRAADLLLTISESTRSDAISLLHLPPAKVVNISADADDFTSGDHSSWSATKARLGLTREVVLYTGGIDHRKNIDRLIAAYAEIDPALRRTHQLAIVCKVEEHVAANYAREAHRRGLAADEVVFTDFVSHSELADLYANCALFVFPSWYEGFGLPVLEAMRSGAVVVGSNASSLPEIVGISDALFDPHSTPDIARSITLGITDKRFRDAFRTHAREHVRQFSWDRTVVTALDAIENSWAERRAAHRPQVKARPTLAFVSPMPPQRSGVAHYGAEILPYLAEHYDIDVVVADDALPTSTAQEGLVLRSVTWFRENAGGYDRILYQFGNSSYHAHMPGLLRDFPGVVILHDFYLGGLFFFMQHTLGWKPAFTHALFASHGYAPFIALANGASEGDLRAVHPANYSVLSQSLGAITHSRYAANLTRSFFGEEPARVVRVAPAMQLPVTLVSRDQARKSLRIAPEQFLICSFGFVASTKLDDCILQAWAAARTRITAPSRVVLVGEAGSDIADRLRADAAALKVELTITGWVDQSTYSLYLSAADLAIQLRTDSRGETSAAILECLAAGLPVVVNANGSLAELPDDAVLKLEDSFDNADLTDAIVELWANPDRRAALARKGLGFVRDVHAPERTAESYRDAIEAFYAGPANAIPIATRKAVGFLRDSEPSKSVEFATSLARIRPQMHQKQKLVMVDPGASLEHARGLLERDVAEPGTRLELVYLDRGGTLRYARKLAESALGVSIGLEDSPADYYAGDELVVDDPGAVDLGAVLRDLRRHGVAMRTDGAPLKDMNLDDSVG